MCVTMRMPEKVSQDRKGGVTWQKIVVGDARISFFPKRPERRRDTDRPMADKNLEESLKRGEMGGSGDGRRRCWLRACKGQPKRTPPLSAPIHTPKTNPDSQKRQRH